MAGVQSSVPVVPRAASASASEQRRVGIVAGACAFRPPARLRQAAEFAAVMASPLRSRSKHFEIRYLHNQHSFARLGLVVPKRLARHAVLRNLLKRLARESFRGVQRRLPAVDVVVRLAKVLVPSDRANREFRRIWRYELDQLLLGLAK